MSEAFLKELKESFEKTFVEFKKTNDLALETNKAEYKANVDKIAKQLDVIELKFKEIELGDKKSKKENSWIESKECIALHDYMKHGAEDMKVENKSILLEEKAKLIAGENPLGGYLVRPEFEDIIQKNLTEFNPLREYARVTSGNARSFIYSKRISLSKGYWVGEQGDVVEDASKYGQGEIIAHAMAVDVPVSNELLQDSFANIQNEVSMDASEGFADVEGTGFVTGNNVQKPEGLTLSTNGIERLDTVGSGALIPDDVISLMFKLKTPYARSGSAFFGNRQILAHLRKAKGTDGQYIVSTVQTGGIQFNLFGTPFVELPAMDDTVSAGKQVLIYGDMFRGYRIYDRVGMSILRDPYTKKKQRMVEFQFEKRTGGAVYLAEALKILKIKA
jgi:HK97 family phage major capsid protein